jgi:hypothetical protein
MADPHAHKSGVKAVPWKIKEIGGFDLTWNPYGERTLVRYATEEEHDGFVKSKRYSPVSYGGSKDKAIWFATQGGKYDAGFAEGRPWKVTVRVGLTEQTPFIHAEAAEFKGEAGHRDQVIIKNNEEGAYGIGRDFIDKLKPQWSTND